MRFFVSFLAGLALTGVAACASPPSDLRVEAPAPPAAVAPVIAQDVTSYARPEVARVTHVNLDLRADFAAQQLVGTATLDLLTAPGASQLILDTRDLTIEAVTDEAGRALPFRLGPAQGVKGAPLEITLNGARRVTVRYRTAPEAAALQWLSPAQTAGKSRPYLFSQGQPTLTRSWVPTQDSPGIRQTYAARIIAPEGLRAVMSAEMLTPEGEAAEGGRAYRFRMDRPIPPYLIALAVGDIAFRPLGPRSGVYAEPATIERAAAEFDDLERMIAAAESLYGPYRWGRYDLLILPPAFPYGGMENPRLTFATPTIIAGDKSLVSLVAHELAHSWSGNLVTNATWADNWLNEGFTTYFENRIMEALYGPERATMEAQLSFATLEKTVADLGPTSPQAQLHLAPDPLDPDEGGSQVIYEKGAAFLATVERIVGRERLDAWLRSYFDRNAFRPMTTERMLADFRANVVQGDAALEQRLQLDRWIFQPGIPDNAYRPRSAAFTAVEVQAKAFTDGAPASGLPWDRWTTQERQHFIAALPKRLPAARLADLDRTLRLSESGNSEVLFAWLELAVRNRYEPALPALERFLTSMGRRKFVLPLFQALTAEGEWGRPIARRLYAQARPGYHSVTTKSVDPVVNPPA
jgi:leukotriene-A4 hydrolase